MNYLHLALAHARGDQNPIAYTESELAVLETAVVKLSPSDPPATRWAVIAGEVSVAAPALLAAVDALVMQLRSHEGPR